MTMQKQTFNLNKNMPPPPLVMHFKKIVLINYIASTPREKLCSRNRTIVIKIVTFDCLISNRIFIICKFVLFNFTLTGLSQVHACARDVVIAYFIQHCALTNIYVDYVSLLLLPCT